MSHSVNTDPLEYSQDLESENQYNSPTLFNSKLQTLTFISTHQKKYDSEIGSPKVMYDENVNSYKDYLNNIKSTNLERVFVNDKTLFKEDQNETPIYMMDSNIVSPNNMYTSRDNLKNICLSLSTERKSSPKNSTSKITEEITSSNNFLVKNEGNINKDTETVWFTARENLTERSNVQVN